MEHGRRYPDYVVPFDEHPAVRVDTQRWHAHHPEGDLRAIDGARVLEPINLLVFGINAGAPMAVMFLKYLRLVGLGALVKYWNKCLRERAGRVRVWARVQLLSKKLRYRRSTEGQIARAIWAFFRWAEIWKGGRWNLCPPCTSCGEPTGCFCDSCAGNSRYFGDNSLCTECDRKNDVCILCFRGTQGGFLMF